jgi:hypothetical protein
MDKSVLDPTSRFMDKRLDPLADNEFIEAVTEKFQPDVFIDCP